MDGCQDTRNDAVICNLDQNYNLTPVQQWKRKMATRIMSYQYM